MAVCWKHRPARPRRRAPHVLDWFLRRADDIINRLADYLHATGRNHPHPPHWASYDTNLLIDQVSFTAHALHAHRQQPLK